jgi:hypothetical protein
MIPSSSLLGEFLDTRWFEGAVSTIGFPEADETRLTIVATPLMSSILSVLGWQ